MVISKRHVKHGFYCKLYSRVKSTLKIIKNDIHIAHELPNSRTEILIFNFSVGETVGESVGESEVPGSFETISNRFFGELATF